MIAALLILLLALAFFGGFVGSMMSGGSLIVFSALAFSNVPVRTAIGTLKLAIAVLGLFSAGTYLKGGAVNVKIAPKMILSTVLGSVIGSQIVLSLPDRILRLVVTLLICLGVVSSLRFSPTRVLGKANAPKPGRLLAAVGGVLLGIYIGMLGVASAILSISLLIVLFRLPLLEANGTAKTIIFINNLVACVIYSLHGNVDFSVGIPISIPVAVGAWIGAKTAMKMGGRRLRTLFVGIAAITAMKLLLEAI